LKKVIWDVRNDAKVLYRTFGIEIKNVYDLQILVTWHMMCCYGNNMDYLPGLSKTVSKLGLSFGASDLQHKARAIYEPRFGGTYEKWLERPLDPILVEYCSKDPYYLICMWDKWQLNGLQELKSWLIESTDRTTKATASYVLRSSTVDFQKRKLSHRLSGLQ